MSDLRKSSVLAGRMSGKGIVLAGRMSVTRGRAVYRQEECLVPEEECLAPEEEQCSGRKNVWYLRKSSVLPVRMSGT